MAKQTINTGTTPADHTGDSVRTAFDKVNANFSELYEAAGNAASADELEEHVNDTNNPHGVTKSQVGLGSVDNTSDANKPVSTATQTALNAKATTTALDAETAARIAADALKADLVGGVIPTSQIPAIAITTFLGSVASQAAMLALSGQSGDWCNRSDTSTAWVIIGSNPTQLSSWAQINYPASPVSSVNGQSGVIVLGKADVGLGSVNNTSDADKPVSTAQQTALDLKQNKSSLGADSAAAVHAATSKTTPVDSDEIGAADSAASFGLKRFTWANIKAALKTYFDTLYNNYVLPAPGTTTLGGVKRNAGSAGEFVNGIDSNGALTYATPAGGGGSGGALVRGSGQLKGNTTPHGSPTVPSGFINAGFGGGGGTLSIEINGTTFVITFADFDPADGSTYVNNTAFSGAGDYAYAFESWLNSALSGWVTNVVRSEFYITFDGVSAGSSMYLNLSTTMGGVAISGYTSGTDGAEGYGAVTEVEIIPAVSGKTTFPVRVFVNSDGGIGGVTVEVSLKEGGAYYPLCEEFASGYTAAELLVGSGYAPIGSYTVRWINGLFQGALVARLIGSPVDGGTMTISAICEQQVP